MDKMLYAFDELSRLPHAHSLMRPEGYAGMELKGVKKRFQGKAFAANVNREEIQGCHATAGVELESIMQFIIEKQERSVNPFNQNVLSILPRLVNFIRPVVSPGINLCLVLILHLGNDQFWQPR